MPAPLSVVIPVLNEAKSLPGCAEALFEGLFEGLVREVIVTDGGSDDATALIARELGATWIEGPPGRGGQIARGCAKAAGPWVLILHADTRLQQGWTGAVARHMRDAPEQAGYFWLRFDAKGAAPAFVARWANFRSRWFGLPYGDQGVLLPQALLEKTGGYPDLPLMEDVALADVLKGRLRPLEHIAETSAARYQAKGWFRRGARNLGSLLRYRLGADPKKLLERYRA